MSFLPTWRVIVKQFYLAITHVPRCRHRSIERPIPSLRSQNLPERSCIPLPVSHLYRQSFPAKQRINEVAKSHHKSFVNTPLLWTASVIRGASRTPLLAAGISSRTDCTAHYLAAIKAPPSPRVRAPRHTTSHKHGNIFPAHTILTRYFPPNVRNDPLEWSLHVLLFDIKTWYKRGGRRHEERSAGLFCWVKL